jgi:hypothetical protein
MLLGHQINRNKPMGMRVTSKGITISIIGSLLLTVPMLRPARSAPEQPLAVHLTNWYDNAWHDVIVTEAEIKKTPQWPEEEENPPLSVRKAMSIGIAHVANTFKDGEYWEFISIGLRQNNLKTHWFYVVDFIAPSKDVEKPIFPFHTIVLMNGEPVRITRRMVN